MKRRMKRTLLVLACACGSREVPPAAPPLPPPAPRPAPLPAEAVPVGPLPADVHPVREALELFIDPEVDRLKGAATLTLQLDRPRDVIWLHGRGLTVSDVRVGDVAASYSEVDPSGVARLQLSRPMSGSVVVRIEYSAAYDTQLVGAYRTNHAVFTKFEAIYARRAFPCFDEPAFKIPFDVTLIVPAGTPAVGNMPVASERSDSTRRKVTFQTTPPLPTYLVAFAVGPFDARASNVPASPLRPKPLPVGAIAMTGRAGDTAFALAAAPPIITEQERYFGIAFPYPKIDLLALPDFQSGAMENAGAITFRDSLLLVDDKVASFANKASVVGVLSHELAHQWFGDLVTMRWWDDIWLNEGFAEFMGRRTVRAVRPDLEPELDAIAATNEVMNADSLASARRVRQPIESTHDITNAFDGITYEKGAAFLAMLEHYVGDEPFRRGIHAHLAAHAGGNATTDDLIATLSHETGRDLAPLAASFLDQPGVPSIAVRAVCDGKSGRLELAQTRWRPIGATVADATWTVPVCVRAEVGGRVSATCTLLHERTATVDLPGCPAWVMPNADGAGYYRFALAPEDLAHLRDRGMAKLAVGERLALALDLEAAIRSGALPAADVLRALEPLARDPHGAVAVVPLDAYRLVLDTIVDPTLRPKLARHIAGLYAPIARAVGWKPATNEPASRRTLRTEVLSALALQLDDKATLDEAARLGRRYLGIGGDGKLHPDAVDPDLLGLAVAAALRQGDATVFDAVLARAVAATDAQLRSRLLVALGSVRDGSLLERALGLALDPRLRANERLFTLFFPLSTLETRDQAWAWIEHHFDELAKLLPDRHAARILGAYKICDGKRADAVRNFFGSRAEAYSGMPRELAHALEYAEQCAARAAAQRASVDAYARPFR
jgi:peptidase M1-like protein/ERAP1-like protein